MNTFPLVKKGTFQDLFSLMWIMLGIFKTVATFEYNVLMLLNMEIFLNLFFIY